MDVVHTPSFRFNTILFLGYLGLAVLLWIDMPERYPVHFDLAGNPTRWEERNPGMWILIVALSSISFMKVHLFQRFVFTNPDSPFLNLPYKTHFQKLPGERKLPVLRRVNRMLGLLNAGVLFVFIILLFLIYYSAHNPGSPAAGVANQALLVAVSVVVIYPLVEYVSLRGVIREKLEEEGLLGSPHEVP